MISLSANCIFDLDTLPKHQHLALSLFSEIDYLNPAIDSVLRL
jgi:hypothetical protein